MTVPVQTPWNDLEADGTITTFPFSFSNEERISMVILVGGVEQAEFSTFTIENLTENGGEIEFTEAPPDGSRVLILRQTSIDQQTDYTEAPFPSETHEDTLTKLILILQEITSGATGGLDADGNPIYLSFDLSVTAGITTVTINNTGGTDAEIPPWVSGTLAGVYHGETTLEANVPADESETTKPDGFVWLGI